MISAVHPINEQTSATSGARPGAVDITVVVPVFNESSRILASVTTVVEFLQQGRWTWELIVVSDGSTDNPGSELQELLAQEPKVRLIEYPDNRGKGAAVRMGVAHAGGRRVLFTDADLSAPISQLENLMRALDAGADIAIGSRRLQQSRLQVPQGFLRRFAGNVFSKFVRVSTGLPFLDTQCGFKLFTREAAAAVAHPSREDGFAFDVEWLCLAREQDLRIAEVPVTWSNSDSSTVSPIRHGLRMVGACLKLANPRRLPSVYGRQIALACLFGLVITLGFRFISMALLPMIDNTEGRYGAIAQQMFVSSDWVTPWVWERDQLVPFWGKPPLFFWLTTLSLAVMGVSELAVRLPSFLAGLAMVWLIYRAARTYRGREVACLSALMAGSSLLFLGVSGLVALDSIASLCVTGTVVSYYLYLQERSRRWSYGVFVFLGLGMLAKGPIVVVLAVAPIAIHSLWSRHGRQLRQLPWATGTLLALAICVPWYVLAERATPGFLRYFFVNEHILRYVSADYGDLHGKGHVRPYGTVWPMLALGMMPWLLLVVTGGRQTWGRLWGLIKTPRVSSARLDAAVDNTTSTGGGRLFLVWGLFPVIFFTMARSVLPTYLAPGLGGLAILLAVELDYQLRGERWRRTLLAPCCALLTIPLGVLICSAVFPADLVSWPWVTVPPLLVAGVAILSWRSSDRISLLCAIPVLMLLGTTMVLPGLSPYLEDQVSTRRLVNQIDALNPTQVPTQIVMVGRGEPSIDYYAPTRVVHLADTADPRLQPLINDSLAQTYVIRTKNVSYLVDAHPTVQPVAVVGRFTILRETASRKFRSD